VQSGGDYPAASGWIVTKFKPQNRKTAKCKTAKVQGLVTRLNGVVLLEKNCFKVFAVSALLRFCGFTFYGFAV